MDFGPCIEKKTEGEIVKDDSKVAARLQIKYKRAFIYTKGLPYIA
jgi:hypothetical protein